MKKALIIGSCIAVTVGLVYWYLKKEDNEDERYNNSIGVDQFTMIESKKKSNNTTRVNPKRHRYSTIKRSTK